MLPVSFPESSSFQCFTANLVAWVTLATSLFIKAPCFVLNLSSIWQSCTTLVSEVLKASRFHLILPNSLFLWLWATQRQEFKVLFVGFHPETLLMAKCCCQSSGCAAAGSHEVACIDHSNQVLNAQAASQSALQEQEEVVTSYLAAMMLSDQISGPSLHPGSRLWSKFLSSEDLTNDTPSCFTLNHRELIEHNLKHIWDLEKSLGVIQSEATLKLSSIGSPLEHHAFSPEIAHCSYTGYCGSTWPYKAKGSISSRVQNFCCSLNSRITSKLEAVSMSMVGSGNEMSCRNYSWLSFQTEY